MTNQEQDQSTSPIDHLLDMQQVADYLGIKISRLYNWRNQKVGPVGIKVGNSVRYRRSAVETWLTENTDPS